MKIYNQSTMMTLEEHQAINNLTTDQVGRFFSIRERAVRESQIINAELIHILDTLREKVNRPIVLTSLHRTTAKQEELKQRGFAAAGHSPHLYGCAADIACKNVFEVKAYANLIREISEELNIPVRIGYKQYLDRGQTFVHVDTAPLIFGKEGIYGYIPNVPPAFKSKITW